MADIDIKDSPFAESPVVPIIAVSEVVHNEIERWHRRGYIFDEQKAQDELSEVMRAVLESVGITDVLAKSKGSSNPHNLVKATFEALLELRDAFTVAQHRDISVEKVFNG